MSVTSTASRVSHAADGVATAFAYGFKVLDARHLRVSLRDDASGAETPLSLNSHFTVTGVGSDAGGTVIVPAAPPAGKSVVIVRDMPVTDIAYPTAAVETALDKLVLVAQQLQHRTGRALRFPDGDNPSLATVLPGSVERAGKALAFDANGNVTLASLDADVFDAGVVEWAEVRNTPTTLTGYGITDAAPVQHVFAGGAAHALASASAAGFMSAADKAKLDGLTTSGSTVVSVKDHGAIGDGVADDAPAVSAAIAAVQAAGGGVVHVPEGTYRLGSTVTIAAAFADAAGILLRGDGIMSVLRAGGAIGTMLNVTGDLLSVRDLTLDGAGQGVTGVRHATLNGNDFSRFEGLRFERCTTAFLNDGGDAFNIESCYFNSNTSNVVSQNNGMNSRIAGCYMLGGDGVLFTYPGNSGSGGNKQTEGVRITDNTILPGAASSYGVRIEGGMQIAILGNIIDQCGAAGLYLDASSGTAGARPVVFVTVQGNWFGGHTNATGTIGITTSSAGVIRDLQIVGNTFVANKGYGVDLKANCTDVSLVANSFHDNGSAGGADLSLYGTKRTTAIGNRFRSTGAAYSSIEHTAGTVSYFLGNTFASGRPVTRSAASRYEGNFTDDGGLLADSGTPTATSPAGPRGCLLTRTASTSVASGVGYDVAWDTASWDTDGCFNGATPTRIKVPSWAKFARVSAQITFSSASAIGDRTINIRRITNNDTATGAVYHGRGFANSIGNPPNMNHSPMAMTAWIPVVPGDYFEVRAGQTSGGNLDVVGTYTTWVQAEFA